MTVIRQRRSAAVALGLGAVVGGVVGAILGFISLPALSTVGSLSDPTTAVESVGDWIQSLDDFLPLIVAAVVGAGVGLVAAVAGLWAWVIAIDAAPVHQMRARVWAGAVAFVAVALVGLVLLEANDLTGTWFSALDGASAVLAGVLAFLWAPRIGYRRTAAAASR